MARDAGVLMHITSLPSPCGIGTLGREAYRFADFLKAAGQRYWQILPVGPTSYGDSPYQSFSTYAGNPYLIDLDLLQEEGLLEIDVGDMENMLLSDIGRKYPELAYNWDHAPDLCRFPHGETMEEAYRRVNSAIDRIIAENPGKTVAVTTHGGVIKNLNARVEFGNIQGLRQGKVFGNTSVSVLKAENGALRWKLVNDMSHLPEELRRAPMQYTFHTEAL